MERHGYMLLFVWVLAEQSALPLPSVPLMLAAGALIRAGRLSFLPAIGCCLIAALIGDILWFELGRRRGRQVLGLLCRVSLEPDSCVRQTENAFVKYGLNSLLIAKFIPGFSAVAAPLAGSSKISFRHFALYDGAGVLLWSGSGIGIGYLFSRQLKETAGYIANFGGHLFVLIATMLALWVGWKFFQRRRFLNGLRVARITVTELRERLEQGEALFIIDLRSALGGDPNVIPGAVRMSAESLAARVEEIPRDREIVLVCS